MLKKFRRALRRIRKYISQCQISTFLTKSIIYSDENFLRDPLCLLQITERLVTCVLGIP